MYMAKMFKIQDRWGKEGKRHVVVLSSCRVLSLSMRLFYIIIADMRQFLSQTCMYKLSDCNHEAII